MHAIVCTFYSTGATKFLPPQDVIAVSGNPAYEQVTLKSIAVQENSAYSAVHTVSPPPVDDSSHVHVPLMCANPAYGQRVTSIALQQNSAYSVTHTESVLGAQYENIAVRDEKRNHNNLCECCFSLCVVWLTSVYLQQQLPPVHHRMWYQSVLMLLMERSLVLFCKRTLRIPKHKLHQLQSMRILIGELCSVSPSSCQCVGKHCLFTGGASSLPQSEVPVSANPAYGQLTSDAVQQNNTYSILTN